MSKDHFSNHIIDDTLRGKVALVTGGSRGIGRATCFALAAKGAAVAVHYRSGEAEAQDVVQIIHEGGGQAAAIFGDMLQPDTPAQIVSQTVDQLGGLDILVNNAGGMADGAVEDTPDEDWDHVIDLNLNSVFRTCRAAIPHMAEQNWGRIINVTSQAAWRGSRNHAGYAAAKSGLIVFTYSLALEVAPSNITVNLVAPGRIGTELVLSRSAGRMAQWMSQTPLKRLGTPAETAAPIVFLATEAARYITGATIHVNGGLYMG